MRSDILRVYKSLHTWTGLISGMALFICFFAGALTMFEEPLERWSAPPAAETPTGVQPWVAPERWPALIDATLREHPDAAKAFMLYLQPRENVPAPLLWREGGLRAGPAATTWWATLDENGALRTGVFRPGRMGQLIDDLHRTAGIPGTLGHHHVGDYVMGIIAVLYALALFSGLIVLLPTLVADLFALRLGKNLKRFWLDAHNVIGITSLPFHLVIALTVVVFAFHDLIYDGLGKVAWDGRPMFGGERVRVIADTRPLLPPLELLDRLRERAPQFQPQELVFMNSGRSNAQLRVAGTTDFGMLRSSTRGFATMDPYTGALTDTTYLPGLGSGWGNVITTFFALHFGNFGGALMRWSYFALGISGAFLFYSGNLLWIESRRRRQRRDAVAVEQTRTTYSMAAATVGVCWGSVAGVAVAMVAGKWLHGSVADPAPWYLGVYYTVFLGCVAWAFWHGAARAVVHLLWLCAAASLAIPATGLLTLLLPSLPPWLHTAPDLLAVEVSALLLGLAFVVMARRTARRVHSGDRTDSVWSAPTRRDDSAAALGFGDTRHHVRSGRCP